MNRHRDEESLPQEAWTAQYTHRLRDLLLELDEIQHPQVIVKRVTEPDIVIEPVVVHVARKVVQPAASPNEMLPYLYDEDGLPVVKEFPGAVGKVQARLLTAPAAYRAARWAYRRAGGRSPRV